MATFWMGINDSMESIERIIAGKCAKDFFVESFQKIFKRFYSTIKGMKI